MLITWSVWIYRNNNIFRNLHANAAHIINLPVNLFDNMRYYNVVSRIFGPNDSTDSQIKFKKKDLLKFHWRPPLKVG